ncbi:hypothetical protein C0J52_26912 [Blattella germanica]|nr:hypothetical protein C0J52_26912 [Blattella germanica]
MREDRLPKKIFEWQPMGKRKRERPNITWTEGILKTMRERGLQEGDWEDRMEWHMAINCSLGTGRYLRYCKTCE